MAAGSFEECHFHFVSDAFKMDKIDKTIRLAGLEFPNSSRVIGRKDGDLIVALGGFDIGRNCSGNQYLVAARLCIFYEAILSTHEKYRNLGIDCDSFFETALDYITEKYPNISKYLSKSKLRQVIEIYTRAFHRSGLKPIKPNAKKANVVQETGPAQQDAGQPHDSGSDTFIGENVMDPSEFAEYKGARIKLEKLVKKWMVARAIARSSKAEEPRSAASERQPGEKNNAFILRLQEECTRLCEEKDMYEAESDWGINKNEELGEDYNELSIRYEALLKYGYKMLKEKSDQQAQYLARIGQMQNNHNDQVDRMQDTIDRLTDENDELKQRLSVDGDRWTHVYEVSDQRGPFRGGRGGRGGPRGFAPFSGF